ncbi:MAG TPA: type II secretion system F family protein [Candidatus Dormibacteraeota bacterium]|jgi:tight adherence protein C|nr:type II secretion system F family protein [Candidatus Dormibacteraeota bacterium]
MSPISIILALCVAFGVVLIFQGLSRPQVDLLETRLAQFGDRELTLDEMEMSLPLADRMLRPFLEKLSRTLTSRTPANQQQALQEKLTLAGRPYGLTVGSFLTLQALAFVVFGVLGYGLAALMNQGSTFLILGPVVGGVLGYLVPQSLLSRKIRKRKKEILLALPNALDLLTISVEAGLGFDAAISRVTDKYHNALALEFTRVLNEVRLGRPRMEALDDMGKRNKVDDLNNFVQAIIQSEQLGVGIANVLRIQSEEMRRRRRQRAEEQGQKAPLKMLFPMVGCIFPTLFIVLLGPAVIKVFDQFTGH